MYCLLHQAVQAASGSVGWAWCCCPFEDCSVLRRLQPADGVPGREQISHNGLNAMLIRLVDDALLLARDDASYVNMTNSRSAPAPLHLAACSPAVTQQAMP
jgi:hypothetical protein